MKYLEVYGVKGLENKKFQKSFKDEKSFYKWFEKHEDEVVILGTREIEE
jgi:hypothetical protein